MPGPSVYLLCKRSGRWVGDVLILADGRNDVFLHDDACPEHNHRPPTDGEVAAAAATARRYNISVPIRVHPSM